MRHGGGRRAAGGARISLPPMRAGTVADGARASGAEAVLSSVVAGTSDAAAPAAATGTPATVAVAARSAVSTTSYSPGGNGASTKRPLSGAVPPYVGAPCDVPNAGKTRAKRGPNAGQSAAKRHAVWRPRRPAKLPATRPI